MGFFAVILECNTSNFRVFYVLLTMKEKLIFMCNFWIFLGWEDGQSGQCGIVAPRTLDLKLRKVWFMCFHVWESYDLVTNGLLWV